MSEERINRISAMLPYDESSARGQYLRRGLKLADLLYECDKNSLDDAIRKGYKQLAQHLDFDEFLSVIEAYQKGEYAMPTCEIDCAIVFDNPADFKRFVDASHWEWREEDFGTIRVIDCDQYEVDPLDFGAREAKMAYYCPDNSVLLFYMIFRAEDAGLSWTVNEWGYLILSSRLK